MGQCRVWCVWMLCLGLLYSVFTRGKPEVGMGQSCTLMRKLSNDTKGRLLLLEMEQLLENGRAVVEDCTEEDLVSRPDGKVLKVMQTLSNGEKYLAVHSTWFQEFVLESLGVVQT